MEKLKRIECVPECDFIIKSHDEKEVVQIAKRHTEEKHDMI